MFHCVHSWKCYLWIKCSLRCCDFEAPIFHQRRYQRLEVMGISEVKYQQCIKLKFYKGPPIVGALNHIPIKDRNGFFFKINYLMLINFSFNDHHESTNNIKANNINTQQFTFYIINQ